MICHVQELVPLLARSAAISHHVAMAITARCFLGPVGPNARQILPNVFVVGGEYVRHQMQSTWIQVDIQKRL